MQRTLATLKCPLHYFSAVFSLLSCRGCDIGCIANLATKTVCLLWLQHNYWHKKIINATSVYHNWIRALSRKLVKARVFWSFSGVCPYDAWEVYSSQKFKLSLCGVICLDGNCTVVSQNVRMLPEQMHSSLARNTCNSLWSSKYGKRLRSAEKYMPYRKSSEKAMYAFYVTGLPLLQLSSLCSYYHAVVD